MSFNKHGHNNYKNNNANKKSERYNNASNKLSATNSKHRTSTSCLLNWDDVKIGFKKFKIKRWNSIGSWVGYLFSICLLVFIMGIVLVGECLLMKNSKLTSDCLITKINSKHLENNYLFSKKLHLMQEIKP